MNKKELIRAADAKEVGVGNPAEETYRHPNQKAVSKIRLRGRMSTPFTAPRYFFRKGFRSPPVGAWGEG
jgi:hypothetical protein